MYHYQEERPKLFTDEGQRTFLAVRDSTNKLIALAGAARMDRIMAAARCTGDSWLQLACMDRMKELHEVVEVTPREACGQDRIFTKYNE